MSAVLRRTFLASVLVLVLLTTGAWQNSPAAPANSQPPGQPDTPLYPGLTWSGPASTTQEIRINGRGDTIALPGERYEAQVQFPGGLPREVLDYYSTRQLASSGWLSHDAFGGPDRSHYVYYDGAGTYLSVEYLQCPNLPSSTCLAIWKSGQAQPQSALPGTESATEAVNPPGSFGKTAPANGTSGLDPASITLSWGASSGAVKYSYCVNEGSSCDKDDPDWTSSYDRSITVRNLAFNKTYHWQVRATSCELCVPKPWTYADNDNSWTFRTSSGSGSQVTIVGNAGVGGAVLSYTDGSARQVTADSNGAYTIRVPYNWSGTVTPSKSGYVFVPASASFTNLTAATTIQNFSATAVYVISGNTGLAGVTLSYVVGTPKTVLSDASGNYAFEVPAGWSGTVTPSRISYSFSPASRTYSNVNSNLTGQNYTPTLQTFTISGNTGTAGVTLRYTNGTPQSVLSDGSGNYSFTVPYNWSGTVTPSKTGYIFSPANRTYNSVIANQTAQNYTAIPLYSISGTTGVSGATLSYTDVTPRTITAMADGSYSFIVPGTWAGTVTPDHECYTFNPASRDYSSLTSNLSGQNYTPAIKPGCADVTVQVAGANKGRFGLPAQASTRTSFSGLNQGPAKVAATNAGPLIAEERVVYTVNELATSFTEIIGLPNGQLDKIYWLPWYNSVDLGTQLRIANVSGSQATVRLYIHGSEMTSGCSPSNSPYTLAAGATVRVSCSGVSNGPVMIESDQNIVASARLIYKAGGVETSYAEMLALPNKQVSNTYWLPWYNNNNTTFDTQLHFANLSSSQQTAVHVSIAGQEVANSPFNLQAGESTRVSFAGLNDGPVKVWSDQNLVVSQRVIYKVDGINTSYSETMALPNSQVENTYWLPWYNKNSKFESQLRFANLSSSQQASVHVSIAGQEINGSPFILQAGESTRVTLASATDGIVKIWSDQDLVVSQRVIYKVNGLNTSYTEMMALPDSHLDNTYWWPWYNSNHVDLETQLRFGRP